MPIVIEDTETGARLVMEPEQFHIALQAMGDGIYYRQDDLDGLPADDGDRADVSNTLAEYSAIHDILVGFYEKEGTRQAEW